MIGYGICGSFCTINRSMEILGKLTTAGYDMLPIFSFNAATIDTRFGTASGFLKTAEKLTGHPPILTIEDAEPLGPRMPLEALVIAPCTGNTLAKLSLGITDTPVAMAAKAHMRRTKPLLLALASNDAMSANLKNIAALLEKKNVFFVPLLQDDPVAKPHSLVAEFDIIPDAVGAALRGEQLRPLFLS